MKGFYTGIAGFFLVVFGVLAWITWQEIATTEAYLADNFDNYVAESLTPSSRVAGIGWMALFATLSLLIAFGTMVAATFAKKPAADLSDGDIKKIEKAAEDANEEAQRQERQEREAQRQREAAEEKAATELHDAVINFQPKGKTLEEKSESYLRQLANGLEAGQGMLYLRKNTEKLGITASYAIVLEDHDVQELSMGSGFAGEAARKKRIIHVSDVPEDYIRIYSGLGSARPQHLLIVPLLHKDYVVGVIELATFRKVNAFEEDAVQRIANHLGQQWHAEIKKRVKPAPSPKTEKATA